MLGSIASNALYFFQVGSGLGGLVIGRLGRRWSLEAIQALLRKGPGIYGRPNLFDNPVAVHEHCDPVGAGRILVVHRAVGQGDREVCVAYERVAEAALARKSTILCRIIVRNSDNRDAFVLVLFKKFLKLFALCSSSRC